MIGNAHVQDQFTREALDGLSLHMQAGVFPADTVRRGYGNTRALLSWSLSKANTTRQAYMKTVHGQWAAHAHRARELGAIGNHAAAAGEWLHALFFAPWRAECHHGLLAAAEQVGDEAVLRAERAMRLSPRPALLADEGLRFVELLPDGEDRSCFYATAPADGVIVRYDARAEREMGRLSLPSARCNGVSVAKNGLWVCDMAGRHLVCLSPGGDILASVGLDAMGLTDPALSPYVFSCEGPYGWLIVENAATGKGHLFRTDFSGDKPLARAVESPALADPRYVHVHRGEIYVCDYERLVMLRGRDGGPFEPFMEDAPCGRICRVSGHGGHLYLVVEYDLLVKVGLDGRTVYATFLPQLLGEGLGCVSPLVVDGPDGETLLLSDFRTGMIHRFDV
ncbi:MAG: hypothetical protein AB7E47_06485 [Desulfovibrionaceae bacterium]